MLAPHKPFRLMFGSASGGALAYIVWSFSNAALDLHVGGEHASVTSWTQVGTDQAPTWSEALFVASGTITIPDALDVLPWRATQGGASESGKVPTTPGLHDDFRLLLGTCNLVEYTAGDEPHQGMWPLAERLIGDTLYPPVVAYIHNDDLCYTDNLRVDDSGYSGKISTGAPMTTLSEYDYGLGYAGGWGGLCGNLADAFGGALGGLIPGLQYTMSNVRFLPQWGNHEFGGLGTPQAVNGTLGVDRPNAFHRTGTAGVDFTGDGPGKVVYEQLFEPLHGQTLPSPRDADCKLYFEDFGPLRVIQTDVITRHSGTLETVVLGDDQRDDILEMADTDLPFRLVMLAHSTRPYTDGSGAFKPLIDYLTEYNALLLDTGSTPPSLMDNRRCNGVGGSTVLVHGDYHRGAVKWHYAAAAAGKAAERFLSVHMGTMTRLSGLHGEPGVATGEDDQTAQMASDYSTSNAQAAGPHMLEVIVRGSESPPRLQLRLWREKPGANGEFEVAYERHLVQHRGNRGLAENSPVAAHTISLSAGGMNGLTG